MSAALANRVFEVLGDSLALVIVRELQGAPLTQAELVRSTGASQSAVSRATTSLRLLGMTENASPRGKISLRAPAGVEQLLVAANGLAMDLLAIESADQARLSAREAKWSTVTPSLEQAETSYE